MNRASRLPLWIAVAVAFVTSVAGPRAQTSNGASFSSDAHVQSIQKPGPRPVVAAATPSSVLSFEQASAGSDARFIARGGRSLFLKKDSAVLALSREPSATDPNAVESIRIGFAGANREAAVSGENQLPGNVYYASGRFLGSLAGNPTFRRVRYSQLYRGIDAVFYGNDHEVEFDFQVAPHADASQIRLSLAGTDKITLEPSGDLSLLAGGEQVRLKKPVIYQQHDGIRTEIAGGYRLSRTYSEVRFEIGPYNHNLPVIIDPAVLFATYFGGAGNEFIVQLEANSIGEVYLMGRSSQSSTLPPHQTFPIVAQPSSLECFLTKLSADGTTALYTVVFAGANCGAMEVTNNGKVHVSVAGVGNPTSTVRTLVESTMTLAPLQGSFTIGLGTFQSFAVNAMRVDSSGNLYLIVTFGAGSGLVYELQKVNPQGQLLGKIQLLSAPVYPDGSIPDQVGGGLPGALDVDDAGHAYVIGLVKTPGAITPTANAFHSTMLVKQAPYTNYRSDFLMRVDTTTANAFRIDYATFFGGSKDDPVSAVAFDPSSNDVVVAGATNSPDFPTTPGTFAPSYDVVDNPDEGFLLKFDLSQPAAKQLIYGTFLDPFSFVYSLTMLPGGLPVIAGQATDSAVGDNPFPLVNSLYPPQFTYKNRQFLSVFSPDAKSLMFSSFLDSAPSSQSFYPLLANNGLQTVYAATTTNFPGLSTNSAFQVGIAGGLDVFVRALDASELIAAASSRADLSLTATASPAPVNVGSALTYSIAVTNLGPQAANTVSLTFVLPANVNFQSATPGQGSCQTPAVGSTGTITCSLGTIANGVAAQLSVSVTARAIGPATASLNVTSSTPDPSVANNTVNLVTTVGASNQYQLTTAATGSGSGTVTVSPSGTSCGANCMAYDSGTTVVVTAVPSAGSSFTAFTGGGCGSTNPCSFTITASTTITATFTLNQYQLTTAATGSGSGTVTAFPSGVSCGVNCRTYDYGTTVTVTATPGVGSSFKGFTGGGCGSTNPCSLTITASTTVTASFTLNQLTTATIGSGSGSVTVSPSGVSCGVNCTTYDSGTTVTVTATPSAGSSFIGFGFSGGGCSSTNPCSFTINAPTSITATFGLDLPPTGFAGYLYALVDVTNTNNKLYGFKVDGTGALTPLGSPFPLPIGDSGNGVFGSERLAYDGHHKRLYVLHDGFHYVSTHVMDLGSGILTLESGPSLQNGGNWDCAALHPGGSPLVVGAGSLGRLASFAEPGSVPTLPTILGGGSFTGTARPFSCVFSQDGQFVYAGGNGNTNGGGTTIAGFSVNSTTGDLLPVPGSPFDVGSSVAAPYATDSDGRLFAADFLGGLLRVFTTSGGVPTAVNGSPFSSGISRLTHAVLHPAGLYMLADFDGNQIGVYQVGGSGAATTLTAVAGSPFPSGGTAPRVLALNEAGDLLFAANTTSHNITSFAVNAATGHLTSLGTPLANALGTAGTVTGLVFVPLHQPVTLPPTIAKAFGSKTITLGDTTTMTFTLGNPNSWYLRGVAFTDPLPSGMNVANVNAFTNSCSGTVTVAADLQSIALADGYLPSSGTCTVSATITGNTLGSWTNVTGNIRSSEGGTGGTASATLTVVNPIPQTIDYSISATPAQLLANSTGTSQITLQSLNGIGDTVNLSAAWAGTPPTGITFTLSPAQVNVPSTGDQVFATLQFTTTASPSPGPLTVRITATSSSNVTNQTTVTVQIGSSGSPSTCGCTKTGPFVDPQVEGLVVGSPFATVDISGGHLLVTNNTTHAHIDDESLIGIGAWGFSPNGKYFVVIKKGPPVSLTLYSVDRAARVGQELTSVLSWGFSPDDDNRFLLVTSSTSVNTQAIIDIYTSDTGARVMESTANYSAIPDWTDTDPNVVATIKTRDLGGWGFSPDGYSFLLSYKTGPTSYTLSLWNLTHTNSSPVSETETALFTFWQFSPCGDLLMIVSQAALNLSTSDYSRFLFTSNGQPYKSNINVTVSQSPSATVVAKADGSRDIQLTGMSLTSIPAPPCTDQSSSSSLPTPPTCGCTKTGPFVNPQVAGLVVGSPLATVDISSGQLLVTNNTTHAHIDNESLIGIAAWGFSPNGKYFVVIKTGPPVSLTLYSVDRAARVGQELTSVLSWGFSPDDDNRFLLVTSSTSVNTQAIIDIYKSDTGARVMESTANYTAIPDWTDPNQVANITTGALGGWGFSPGGYAFLLSYKSGSAYTLTLSNLANASSVVSETETAAATFWQFSPCGDLLMIVSQVAVAHPATSDFVRFLYTSNGQPYKSNINLTLAQNPSATVVAKADGSRDIQLTGMSLTTIASPQCSLSVAAFSPVDIVLSDELARRTGFDLVTGGSINEIPGGTYTGVGSEPQTVQVPFVAGTYMLDAVGLDSLTSPQPYHLRFATTDGSGAVFDRIEVSAMASRGNQDIYIFTVGNGPITPQQINTPDVTPPDTLCASPDGQWHASDVSLACAASDSNSGLASPADAAFLLATHVAAGVETGNAVTDSRQVCDKAGNCTTAGPLGGNKVDKKAPTVIVTAPAGNYIVGQAVAASYSCTDGGSGIASCGGPVASGADVDTRTIGANSFLVTSLDNVGNRSSAGASYSVAYNICPLYAVVAKQSGSAYPIKIRLCDASGNNMSTPSVAVNAVSVTRLSSNTPVTLDDVGDANPDFDFRYDATLAGYILNLSTKGYSTGTYRLDFTAGNDPVVHSALFAVK